MDKNFSQWMKTQRVKRCLSLRKLAVLSGIHNTTLSKIETGKREATDEHIATLIELFKKYKVPNDFKNAFNRDIVNLGITKSQLTKHCGVSHKTFWKMENRAADGDESAKVWLNHKLNNLYRNGGTT